jgi:restriction system protein
MKGYEVVEKLRERVTFDDWDKERYEKTGYIRWESIFQFYSIPLQKAGYIQRIKGTWILTPEGEEAMKLGGEAIADNATRAYRTWKEGQAGKEVLKGETESLTETIENVEQNQATLLSQYEAKASQGLRDYIAKKNPYEFQDLAAALLKAMDYHISWIAARGKDGGVDIVAYQDPLGTKVPRIKVQVKHYPNGSVGPEPIRSLKGLLNPGEEIGLVVTSGTFTSEAARFARETNVHIKLVDGDELVELWQEYYDKLSDEDKNYLPLHPIYFLGNNE